MIWHVDFTDDAERTFRKLPKAEQVRIARYINERLETRFDPKRFAKPLQGIRSGLWRWRVGDYRLIGRLENSTLIILVVDIGHRKEVYRTK